MSLREDSNGQHEIWLAKLVDGVTHEELVEEGTCSLNEFVKLLRRHRHNPDVIRYLADMFEE